MVGKPTTTLGSPARGVLARDAACTVLNAVIVAPLTTTIRHIPTAVPLDPQADSVPRPSVVSLDSILTIRKDLLDTLIVGLRPTKLEAIEQAIHFALDLHH